MDWPMVAVVLVTYDRPDELRTTMRALAANLFYPNLRIHVADDGTPAPYLETAMEEARTLWPGPPGAVSSSQTARRGWGANVNAALKVILDAGLTYVYQQEDDYVLQTRLDLREGVDLLMRVNEVGLVRYDGITGHRLAARLREHKTENEFRQGRANPARLSWWDIQTEGSEELYVYSNRPHLKHLWRFHHTYGMYPEGLALGETEETFAHKIKNGDYSQHVAVLPDWVIPQFDHVGKSRQLTAADAETVTPRGQT